MLSRTTTSSDEALVSVIIPCYNHARFLGEAIVSVIRQSYPHIEIIVVDDGSTDDTEQVITSYPNIQHIRQENLGVSRARNMGLSMSRGAYVLFLDADDRLLPDAVATGVHALASRKEYAFAFGLFVSIGKLELPQGLCEDARQINRPSVSSLGRSDLATEQRSRHTNL